jgi:hypothetical protein
MVECKKLVIQPLKMLEVEQIHEHGESGEELLLLEQSNQQSNENLRFTPLSTYIVSESAEIMHRQNVASPEGSLWGAKRIAKLIYKEHVFWEQLREAYGRMQLC